MSIDKLLYNLYDTGMTKSLERDNERDNRLIEFYELVRKGEKTIFDMQIEFSISAARIYQILKFYKVKRIKTKKKSK